MSDGIRGFHVRYKFPSDSALSNGYLVFNKRSNILLLKNEKRETVRQGAVASDTINENSKRGDLLPLCGCEIILGQEIIKPATSKPPALSRAADSHLVVKPLAVSGTKRPLPDDHPCADILPVSSKAASSSVVHTVCSQKRKLLSSSSSSSSSSSAPPIGVVNQQIVPTLDEALLCKMRPHQVDAATFLLGRLLGVDTDIVSSTDIPVTGAILADAVGTGKTLTSLSVLWALIRRGRAKGLIVCPTSLVQHWKKEIKRWLPSSLGNTALFACAGETSRASSPNAIVGYFIRNPPEVHPLLVISYELYRNFSDALNAIPSLDVLVCDEGHRLKNVYGTQTSTALSNCGAFRRLVLTGTPVQNNLDELYAMVHFAVPWYLGTLKEFQVNYSDVIATHQRSMSTEVCEAADELKARLSRILIRRTHDDILRFILPPRRELIVSIELSSQQRAEYMIEMQKISDELKCASDMKSVLPTLSKLRQICTKSIKDTGTHDMDEGFRRSDNTRYQISSKFKFLEHLLLQIKESNPKERVIITSNYIENLDECKKIALRHSWPSCRIDGSVPSDKRQKLLDLFNDAGSPFFLMFLSTKAGGVGLNLTGANRIVLLEPDWNPATDVQAMGRIYREGQSRPVFIYRMVSSGTIEEGILRSQQEKHALSAVIPSLEDTTDDVSLSEDVLETAPPSKSLSSDIQKVPTIFSIQSLLRMVETLPQERSSSLHVSISSSGGKMLLSSDDSDSVDVPLGVGYDTSRGPSKEDNDIENAENLLLLKVVNSFSSSLLSPVE